MSVPVPTVEERLRVALVYLDAIKSFALLVDEPVPVPEAEIMQALAKWIAHVATVTAAQVSAVRAVLPTTCTGLDAPLVPGGAR